MQTRTHKFIGAGAGAKNETEILQREAEGAMIKMGELITFVFLIERKRYSYIERVPLQDC